MALSQRQHQVLAQMGIPVWERRYHDVSPVAHRPSGTNEQGEGQAETDNVQNVLNGCCVIVVPSLPLAQSEQSLLAAMLRTISLVPEQVDLISEASFKVLTAELPDSKPVWFIGAEEINDNRYLSLYSDSLSQLLAEPQRKASAWQALKQLTRRIK